MQRALSSHALKAVDPLTRGCICFLEKPSVCRKGVVKMDWLELLSAVVCHYEAILRVLYFILKHKKKQK